MQVKRNYGQHCALARALDVVGSRWTLLVIRELLPGPRRFKDLLGSLPGMGTNVLTDRLRGLEQDGLVERRTLPPPAGSTVYELTEEGRRLEGAMFELARWAFPRMHERRDSDQLNARWAMLAMKAGYSQEAAEGADGVYEFRVDDELFTIEVRDGEVQLFDGPAREPDAVITTDTETLYALGTDPDGLERALADGRLRSEGDPEALAHCTAIFLPARTPATR